MAAPNVQPARAEAWARAHLRRGSSGGQVWEISSEYPEARLTLGTDPSAGWNIDGHGVQSIHCELFWDGQALWVADIRQVGGVFLDGMRVSDWVQIQGPAELRFGQASMDIETSVPAGQRMATNPDHAKPVTMTDTVAPPDSGRLSSPQFGGAAGDQSVPDLESEKTRMVAPVTMDDDARTDFAIVSPPQPSMDLRPRLGGAVSASAAPDPHHNEATRMVPIPVAPVTAGPPKIGTPLGAPMPPPMVPPMVPLAGPPAPVVAPPPRAPAPPPPSPPPIALDAPPPPLMPPPPPGEPGHGFAAPPPPAVDESKANPLGKVWEVIKPEKPETEGKQAMPTRTWILLGVTVAVTVGWLLWDDTPEEVPARPSLTTPAQTVAAEDPPPVEEPPPVAEPPVADPTVADPPPSTEPTTAPVAEAPSSPPASGSESGDGEEGPTLQRRAADAYYAGDYPAAVSVYRDLAAQNPDDPSFAAMVRILDRRIAEQQER